MLQQNFFFLSPKKDKEHASTKFFSLSPKKNEEHAPAKQSKTKNINYSQIIQRK